ncbi:hypothetical protein D9M71_822310 [compost metagenome]
MATRRGPDEHFDLDLWYDEGTCGTTACAVGWACLDPWFNDQGLMLNRDTIFEDPQFGELRQWEAVCAFFGISQGQAEHLFFYLSYAANERRNPLAVVARIEGMLGGAV